MFADVTMTTDDHIYQPRQLQLGCAPSGYVTWAQRRFLTTIFLTACLVVIVEVFFSGKIHLEQPPYYLSQRRIAVAVEDDRRLGNLMFNYASLLGIARTNRMVPVLPPESQLREVFLLSMKNGSWKSSLKTYVSHEEFGKRACAYDVRTRKLPEPFDAVLRGYFQSWHYFVNISDEVRREFTLKPHIQLLGEKFLFSNTPKDMDFSSVVKVGIHVRRGDQNEPYFIQYGYQVASAEYIQHAMNYFLERHVNVVFFVCSDDMMWCKENIKTKNVIFSENHDALTDFSILTQCDHVIMTVGSFGWWAAWLANGTTIYYKNWPRPLSKLEYDVNKKQYFPPKWIPME